MAQNDYPAFEVRTPPELGGDGVAPDAYPVAIIGAGPIGLSAAIDLAQHGIRSVLLDEDNVVSVGSRAICWAKRSLEIFDRLGVGQRMLAKGVTWQVGRLFHGSEQVFDFNLLPEPGHQYPAFINLQQYYVEQYLVERCADFPDLIDLRFKNKVVDHQEDGSSVALTVETPVGTYQLSASYVLACDGSGSPTRKRMGLPFEGETFEEHFLIADVRMDEAPFKTEAAERWFWFAPTFHPGQSALLHKQPDNVYRIDLQLGPDADAAVETAEEVVIPRIRSVVGDKPFSLEWVSTYRFRCARLERFVHGRVLFVGDSAHVVSPFGARGGNGGIHDVDNLCWKLAAVLKNQAPDSLLASYDAERTHGADENILNSARATNFMTPKSSTESLFRDEVLNLAHRLPFARRLINSGRLSAPCSLAGFELLSGGVDGPLSVGEPATDLPLTGQQGESCWLSSLVGGRFALLSIDLEASDGPAGVDLIQVWTDPKQPLASSQMYFDQEGLARKRYGHGICYLLRPDGHVCASFAGMPSISQINAAVDRACGRLSSQEVSQ